MPQIPKHNDKYEKQIQILAENRIETGNYKVFDQDARIITRKELPGKGRCIIMTNREGETIVIDPHFELQLKAALLGKL